MSHSKNLSSLTLLFLFLAGGCIAENGDGDGGASDTETAPPNNSNKCYSVAVNRDGTGESACATTLCSAGQYCFDSIAGHCDPGCLNEFDCAQGQYCVMSNNGVVNAHGDIVGVCAMPSAHHEMPCSEPEPANCTQTCGDKAAACQAPPDMANGMCAQLCSMAPTDDQLTCITNTSCAELGQAYETGGGICGMTR